MLYRGVDIRGMAKRKKVRVAINGFGRIGRAAFRIALARKDIDIVAINDLTDAKTLAHLLKYDSVFRTFDRDVSATKTSLRVDRKQFPIYAKADPSKLPWRRLKVDVVLECTGRFTKNDEAKIHLKAGAKRVIVSAPVEGGTTPTLLLGVNEKSYAKGTTMISNASCTTNCIAPVAAIMSEKFGIRKAMMTTIHSYTMDQRLHDAPHSDLRRARAAAQNIIPTTTGAATATAQVIPKLKGLFDGLSLRVPTINVSLSDFTFLVKRKTDIKEVNRVLVLASKSPRYKGILGVTDEPLVSSDFIGDPRSSIVDLSLTNVVDGDMVKVIAWYDNEWGYSNRLIELIRLVR